MSGILSLGYSDFDISSDDDSWRLLSEIESSSWQYLIFICVSEKDFLLLLRFFSGVKVTSSESLEVELPSRLCKDFRLRFTGFFDCSAFKLFFDSNDWFLVRV